MVNKVTATFLGIDLLFAATGAIVLAFSVIVKTQCLETPTNGTMAARNLLYQMFPFTAGIANGVLTFIAFLFTLPAMATNSRGWYKFAAAIVIASGLFTLGIGLDLWILTLRVKENFSPIWNAQSSAVQSLMQTSFQCCGYANSTSPAFVTDSVCNSPASAALMSGCESLISRFSNTFIDDIFTSLFGIVVVDTLLILAIACVLKDRKEMERFRYIDEKNGVRGTF
ncbi:tetraspanin [Xylariaceae sp. FL0255]|nr:tetraspanin [Xylariaceae sp. FL0255]